MGKHVKVMMIRTYKEWLSTQDLGDRHDIDFEDEVPFPFYLTGGDLKTSYEAGVKAASDHFELEKIKIHEYYQEKLNVLFGTEEFKASENNGGKLT